MIKNIAFILCADQKMDEPISISKINGKYLYDYTVSSLNHFGVDDIYIIVDDYNYHLYDKTCPNLNIISLPSENKYSLHTLCYHELNEKFDNLYLIDGNIFFDRKAIELLMVDKNENSVIVSNPRFNRLSFNPAIKDGLITDIKPTNSLLKEGKELLGVYKISYDLYLSVKEEYRNGAIISVENAILNSGHNLSSLYIDDFVWYELEDSRSLELLEAEYFPRVERIYNNQKIYNNIAKLFNEKCNKLVSSIDSLGGMTNKNYHVKTIDENDYVIRIPGEGTESVIDRVAEKENTYVVASSGIDVEPSYFCDTTGIKITSFIANAETLNPETIKIYTKECINTLKRLHCIDVKLSNDFSIRQEILKYAANVNDLELYPNLQGMIDRAFILIDLYEDLDIVTCPCHNDTVAENFIKSLNHMYIIDWEYSAMNDPIWDLAAMILENGFNEEQASIALLSYYDREMSQQECFRLECCYIFQDLLWTIWSVAKCEAGVDYYDYGLSRFNRLKINMDNFNDKS